MTYPRQNDIPDRVRNAEETLRMIARMPAPQGLVDRVQAGLRSAPRRSAFLNWSGFGSNGWMYSPLLRGCAAAAIVLLVAGGGWSIYSRVQPSASAKITVVPARVGNSGGFSNAGAMRTPDTLNGPILANPALANPALAHPAVPNKQIAPEPKPAAHKKRAAGPAPQLPGIPR
jgi:hypothetical protein